MNKYYFTNTTENIDDQHEYIQIYFDQLNLDELFKQLILTNNWKYNSIIIGFPHDNKLPLLHYYNGIAKMKFEDLDQDIILEDSNLFDHEDSDYFEDSEYIILKDNYLKKHLFMKTLFFDHKLASFNKIKY